MTDPDVPSFDPFDGKVVTYRLVACDCSEDCESKILKIEMDGEEESYAKFIELGEYPERDAAILMLACESSGVGWPG